MILGFCQGGLWLRASFCGHLFTLEDIDHSRLKPKHPQTNGIFIRFHRTMQDEFYVVAFRKKIFQSKDELQTEVDKWIDY